jgi:hypothetical protein
MMISRNLADTLLPKKMVVLFYKLSIRFPGVAAFLLSIFLYFPPLWLYSGLDESSDRFGLMMQQARNPFSIRYDTIDNVLAYRLIVPLFNHVLGLRGNWISLPSILGALGLCLLTARIFRGVASGKLVLAFVLLVAFSQIVVSGTTFWSGTDSLAIATVLGIVFVRNQWVENLLIFLAISMDERSIVAILLMPLLLRASNNGETASVRDHLFLFISWFPGLAAAAAFRALIFTGIIFPPPVQNYQYKIIASGLISSATFSPFSLGYTAIQWITSLRWLWVFFAVLVVRFLSGLRSGAFRVRGLAAALDSSWFGLGFDLGIIFLYFFLNLAAGDQWRCALYVFPVIYAAIILGAREGLAKKIAFPLLALMVVTPQVYLGSAHGTLVSLQMTYAMPLVLVRLIMGS